MIEGVRQERKESQFTVAFITDTGLPLPDFALEPESFGTRLSDLIHGHDIDFSSAPAFSRKYYLRGFDEDKIRDFFQPEIITFLETHDAIHIECHKHKLLIHKKMDTLTAGKVAELEQWAAAFVTAAQRKVRVTL